MWKDTSILMGLMIGNQIGEVMYRYLMPESG
jgi:hypothetical protein